MSYAVFVNSTDHFEDCWEPFFSLFEKYWPDCEVPIWLNTETKSYQHQGLDIRSTQVGPELAKGKDCWSASLIKALRKIEETHILYLQEDYFIKGPVRRNVIDSFLEVMTGDNVGHLLLQRRGGVPSPGPLQGRPGIRLLPPHGSYYFSLQAGLWDREVMLACLRSGEDAWTAERRGTRRARKLDTRFCFADAEIYNEEDAIVPYTPTGIIGGKWFAPAVVDLFDRHHLEVDFSKRGFFDETQLRSPKARMRQIFRRLLTKF